MAGVVRGGGGGGGCGGGIIQWCMARVDEIGGSANSRPEDKGYDADKRRTRREEGDAFPREQMVRAAEHALVPETAIHFAGEDDVAESFADASAVVRSRGMLRSARRGNLRPVIGSGPWNGRGLGGVRDGSRRRERDNLRFPWAVVLPGDLQRSGAVRVRNIPFLAHFFAFHPLQNFCSCV